MAAANEMSSLFFRTHLSFRRPRQHLAGPSRRTSEGDQLVMSVMGEAMGCPATQLHPLSSACKPRIYFDVQGEKLGFLFEWCVAFWGPKSSLPLKSSNEISSTVFWRGILPQRKMAKIRRLVRAVTRLHRAHPKTERLR